MSLVENWKITLGGGVTWWLLRLPRRLSLWLHSCFGNSTPYFSMSAFRSSCRRWKSPSGQWNTGLSSTSCSPCQAEKYFQPPRFHFPSSKTSLPLPPLKHLRPRIQLLESFSLYFNSRRAPGKTKQFMVQQDSEQLNPRNWNVLLPNRLPPKWKIKRKSKAKFRPVF